MHRVERTTLSHRDLEIREAVGDFLKVDFPAWNIKAKAIFSMK